MLSIALLLVFPFAMIYAASSDLVSMTIANRVSLILVAAFLVLSPMLGLSAQEMGLHMGVGALCLVVTFGFFAAGWMGGGDAKLLAATAIWFGPGPDLVAYLAVGAIYGGILTIALLMSRMYLAPVTRIDFIDRLLEVETGIPYGIALGAAGLTVYSSSIYMDIALKGLASF